MIRYLLALFVLILCGCSAHSRMAPVTNKYLEDVDITKKIKTMPFEHSWVWSEVKKASYPSIYIAPIRVDTLDTDGWETNASAVITSKADYINEANQVAKHFRDELIKKFKEYPEASYKVTDTPGAGTFKISIALTELEFAHPVAQAGALAAPVPGAGAALGSFTTPHAAFALRITDPESNLLIATAADRKFPPTRLVDLNKLTVTSSAREICSNWAVEIAEAVNKGELGTVESRGTFSILPW